MSHRNVFLALPEELYAEAREIARQRHLSLSDLLIEALSETIEAQQRKGWRLEQKPIPVKGPVRVH